MTTHEPERRALHRQQSDPIFDRETALGRNRILTFHDWCWLNGISPATGRRIIKSGKGPTITRLSPRRIGISVAANADWQASRTCSTGDT